MKITLNNESIRADIDSNGCYIEGLEFRENEIIKRTQDGHKTHGGCAPLFPYANRIKGGKYEWLGKSYEFKKDLDGNSIHGFAKDRQWDIIDQSENSVRMKMNLMDDSYPFDVDVTVVIEISNDGFRENARFFNNHNTTVPLSPGFHPYFVTGSTWEIFLKSRPLKSLKIDQYFPSGNYSEFYRHFYKKESHVYDDCFMYSGDIQLRGDYFVYDVKRTNSEFFMVYDGKFSDSISVAIEPMASEVNSFQTGNMLKILKPGEEWEFGYSVSISSL
jgi:aldose 1-epimerase